MKRIDWKKIQALGVTGSDRLIIALKAMYHGDETLMTEEAVSQQIPLPELKKNGLDVICENRYSNMGLAICSDHGYMDEGMIRGFKVVASEQKVELVEGTVINLNLGDVYFCYSDKEAQQKNLRFYVAVANLNSLEFEDKRRDVFLCLVPVELIDQLS